MKKLLLTLLLVVLASTTTKAMEIDTIWYRDMIAEAQEVDFTPDDRYVIAWTNGIEFWEVQQGVKEFFIPSETVGDYNYNEEFLVFAQDSTPKLLNWQTREVIEGFGKMESKIERIKTAKSKNEFMAKIAQDSNIIYFWDINSKQVIDNFHFVYSFEKNNFKWKKTVHEYGYVGNNDELIYVIIDDANDVLENINPKYREKHYYVNFYNRETKMLVDSVFSFTNTNEQFGGFNYLQVMNDRTKIAWNHKGGEINFYDIFQKRFYDKIVFDNEKYTATDIEFNRNGKYMAVTQSGPCCRYIKIYDATSLELVYYSNKGGKDNVSFSNNDNLLVANANSFLLLFPSHITTTNINSNESNFGLKITPNPAINSINIEFQSNQGTIFRLSLIDLIGNEIDNIDDGYTNSHNYSTNYNIANIPSNTYFIRLEVGNEIITKQFIKE